MSEVKSGRNVKFFFIQLPVCASATRSRVAPAPSGLLLFAVHEQGPNVEPSVPLLTPSLVELE